MKNLIQEGFQQLDLNNLDGWKIAEVAQRTADKIIPHIQKKKNKSGDGTNVKKSRPKSLPVTPVQSNYNATFYFYF